MTTRNASRGAVAMLAWTLVYETWKALRLKAPPPVFLPPGEPLRQDALEAARVLYDDLLEHRGATSYIEEQITPAPGLLYSWIVPFGPPASVSHMLSPIRWIVRCALTGGKTLGQRHGRLSRYMAVPNWKSFLRQQGFRDVVFDYHQRVGSASPKRVLNG